MAEKLYETLLKASSEEEVNAPDRFESDFMVRYLTGTTGILPVEDDKLRLSDALADKLRPKVYEYGFLK